MGTFAGSRSMRDNYTADTVDGYYAAHGAEYRNPHVRGICAATHHIFNVWARAMLAAAHTEVAHDLQQCLPRLGCPASMLQHFSTVHQQPVADADPDAEEAGPDAQQPSTSTPPLIIIPPPCDNYGPGPCIRVLDLACGSGEASQAVAAWWYAVTNTQPPASTPVPAQPSLAPTQVPVGAGVDGASASVASQAVHTADEPADDSTAHVSEGTAQLSEGTAQLSEGTAQLSEGRDQAANAAGQGGDTSIMHGAAAAAAQVACGEQAALEAQQAVPLQLCIDGADPYTSAAYQAWTGRCADTYSFQDVAAGHLTELGRTYHVCICSYAMHVLDTSFLFATLQQLSLVCEALIIISPHKLPKVDEGTGWRLVEHLVTERVHARLYESQSLLYADELQIVIPLV